VTFQGTAVSGFLPPVFAHPAGDLPGHGGLGVLPPSLLHPPGGLPRHGNIGVPTPISSPSSAHVCGMVGTFAGAIPSCRVADFRPASAPPRGLPAKLASPSPVYRALPAKLASRSSARLVLPAKLAPRVCAVDADAGCDRQPCRSDQLVSSRLCARVASSVAVVRRSSPPPPVDRPALYRNIPADGPQLQYWCRCIRRM